MGVTATVELSVTTCPFGEAIADLPNGRVHLERIVPTGNEFLPYFWTNAAHVREVTAHLETAAVVRSCRVVEVVGDRALVRIDWQDEDVEFLDIVEDNGGTILDAICRSDGWTVTVRFDDHADLGECYRQCVGADIRATVGSVRTVTPPSDGPSMTDLTDRQRTTLLKAYENGYFDVPRETDLRGLAAELGVSDTAVSQRLRRGIGVLVENAIVEGGFDDDEE